MADKQEVGVLEDVGSPILTLGNRGEGDVERPEIHFVSGVGQNVEALVILGHIKVVDLWTVRVDVRIYPFEILNTLCVSRLATPSFRNDDIHVFVLINIHSDNLLLVLV